MQSAVHGMDDRVVADALTEQCSAYLGVALLPASLTDGELRRLDRLGFRGCVFQLGRTLGRTLAPDRVDRGNLGPRPPARRQRLASADPYGRLSARGDGAGFGAFTGPRRHRSYWSDRPGPGVPQAAFQHLLRLLRQDRLWVKVSGCDRITRTGPPYVDALPFARKLVGEFPDRVLQGTDWPPIPTIQTPSLMMARWSTSSPRWPPRRNYFRSQRKSAAALRP